PFGVGQAEAAGAGVAEISERGDLVGVVERRAAGGRAGQGAGGADRGAAALANPASGTERDVGSADRASGLVDRPRGGKVDRLAGDEIAADAEIAGDVEREVVAAGSDRGGDSEPLGIGQAEAAGASVGEAAQVGDAVGVVERRAARRRAAQRAGG